MNKKGKHPASVVPAARGSKPSAAVPFEVLFTPDAGKDVAGLDGSLRQQFKNIVEKKLAVNPEGYGTPLRGILTNFWKHEFANQRVIYKIYSAKHLVAVVAVSARKQGDAEDVYKQLEETAKTGKLAGQVASVLRLFMEKDK